MDRSAKPTGGGRAVGGGGEELDREVLRLAEALASEQVRVTVPTLREQPLRGYSVGPYGRRYPTVDNTVGT
jgi:hypothetical protein